ncbi:MAG: methyltransferase domain-containing protein [Rhodospirillales bacterium]
MSWDPELYLRFADQRLRPALDLLSRVDLDAPATVVDLGCGAGNVTACLRKRWPHAAITGVDNSPAMLARARAGDAGILWEAGELSTWTPQRAPDVIYSNAALHWADDHAALFPRLARLLEPGGVLAVQMPHQNGEASHQAAFELARDARWRDALLPVLRASPVADAGRYYDWLAPHAASLDIWETQYLQIMEGDNPVADWTSGTFLLPFLNALEGAARAAFDAEYRARISTAYPRRADGRTLFPFRRLFMVAKI